MQGLIKNRNTFWILIGLIGYTILGFQWTLSAKNFQRAQLINVQWKFFRDSIENAQMPDFDDSKWLSVDLPHDFSIINLPNGDSNDQIGPFSKKAVSMNNTGHTIGGIGWYRKTFVLGNEEIGKCVILKFDGAYMQTDVWVNGTKIGTHKNGYTPFWFDITSLLNPIGKPNTIAVKVENTGRNSRWYSGSGIYRDVHLVITNPVHVEEWGAYITTPEVTSNKATISLQLSLSNDKTSDVLTTVIVNIKDKNGKIHATSAEDIVVTSKTNTVFNKELSVQNPILWSLETPELYTAEIILKEKNNVIDLYNQKFGIRSLQFSADNGFLLNGKKVLLKGACLHHDNGFLGAAAFYRAEYRRVELMKANGFNAIRCAHNPPSEAFLNACDELGVLVIDEFTDMWQHYKNTQDYSRFFNEWWEKDLTDMMKRDRNHPSIIIWSIGNEIPKSNFEEGAKTGEMLASKVKELDTTRPVTEAVTSFLVHGDWDNSENYFNFLDICGYNYVRQEYVSDHQKFPKRVIFCSESYPEQAYDYWKSVVDLPYVVGDFVWSGMDYIGEVLVGNSNYSTNSKEDKPYSVQATKGIPIGTPATTVFDNMAKYDESRWPAYISWCGDIDITGGKKPQGLYRNVLWDVSPVEVNVHEHIKQGQIENISLWGWQKEWPSWTWNVTKGQLLQVRVFTKASTVKLVLNGKSIAEKTLYEKDKYIAVFEIPYEPGYLTAIAYDYGKEIGRKELATADKPAAIKLTVDRKTIKADRNDLSFMKIEVVDDEGVVVPTDSVQIKISVSGNGELVGSGNANPSDMKSFNRTDISTYKGQAQAIIRPFGNKGEIKIMVSTEGLETAELKLVVN